jgi:hypothetical protein
MLKLFPGKFKFRPNVHIGKHIAFIRESIGKPLNTIVSQKEAFHRNGKKVARNCNFHDIEGDMASKANYYLGLRFLMEGGTEGDDDYVQPGPLLVQLFNSGFGESLHVPGIEIGNLKLQVFSFLFFFFFFFFFFKLILFFFGCFFCFFFSFFFFFFFFFENDFS